MTVTPVELDREPESSCLVIQWSDGREQRISYRTLRDRCPCAGCRTAEQTTGPDKGELRILSPAETVPLTITSMVPAGNYAYHIQFSDDHNTGIYPFDLLRTLPDMAESG